jgi:PhnB protein
MKLAYYINFPGNCKEAFNYYSELFEVDIVMMEAFRGSPAEDRAPNEQWLDKIMHAEIVLADCLLMASDVPPGEYKTPQGMRLKISADNLENGKRYFSGLTKYGEIIMPFEKAFWTEGFGMCVDQFSVPWIVDIATK